MRPARTGLVCLLAYLLLMQWAAALVPHARMLAPLGAGGAAEICDHAGRSLVVLDADGQPLPPSAPVDECCVLCHAPAAVAASAPLPITRPAIYAVLTAPRGRPGLPVAPARAPPQQPRAPPSA